MDSYSSRHREDDLELLGSMTGIGYFRVDEDRNVTAVSTEMAEITGFNEEEVLGKPCLSLMRCPSCLRGCGVFEHGRIRDARLEIYRKDGSALEVERSGVSLRNENGEIKGALETIRVVRDRECEGSGSPPAAVEALLSSLGRMFVAADGKFRMRNFSEGLAPLVGRAPEELMGRPISELFGDELFGPEGELRKAVAQGRRKEGWRAHLLSAGGRRIPISLSVGPLSDETGCGDPEVRMVVMIRREDDSEMAPPEVPSFHGIVGRSPAMQRIFRLVDLLGESDSTVLVTGESGTGKELVARAIHETSGRSRGPFVAVNCAALPAELLESELFGHVRGAFTGAVRDRAGRFEMAGGGTLFLDEIGDLDPALQGKILRALQERSFERVGESKTRTVDVRVIAATHVDLDRAVAEHRFREDLYYRLKVIPIRVPPLRERREDLPSLIGHLLDRLGTRHRRALRLSPSASRELMAHSWPGNVRELENTLEFAMTVCEGQTIHVRDLPSQIQEGHTLEGSYPQAPRDESSTGPVQLQAPLAIAHRRDLDAQESADATRIQAALLRCRFNRAETARALGMSRTTLWRKMKQYCL